MHGRNQGGNTRKNKLGSSSKFPGTESFRWGYLPTRNFFVIVSSIRGSMGQDRQKLGSI